MRAGPYSRSFIDGFEAQAERHIAEMSRSACAANESPAIAQLGLRGEIGIDELSQFIADKDTPGAIAFGLMPAEIDDLYTLAIKPAHIADRKCSDFPDTHPCHDAQCQCCLVPETILA